MKTCTTTFEFLAALTLCFFMVACSSDLDENTIRPRAEGKQIQLDSEQVSLTSNQVDCGIKEELWEEASSDGGQQTRYRLTQKGRELQFSDDIYSSGPGYPTPYAQVRGKFYLQMNQVVGVTAGENGSKLIQAKLAVKIPHECFAAPLPLMAIRKGAFTLDGVPRLKYENTEDGWQPTEFLH
jgi:hypothetical protein